MFGVGCPSVAPPPLMYPKSDQPMSSVIRMRTLGFLSAACARPQRVRQSAGRPIVLVFLVSLFVLSLGYLCVFSSLFCVSCFVVVGASDSCGLQVLFAGYAGRTDCIEQQAAGKRFTQIGHAAGGFRLSSRFRFIVRSDENDGHSGTLLPKPLSEIKARHAAQLDVSDDEGSLVVVRIVEECFGREISADLVSSQAQQATQAPGTCFRRRLRPRRSAEFPTWPRECSPAVSPRYCPLGQYPDCQARALDAAQCLPAANRFSLCQPPAQFAQLSRRMSPHLLHDARAMRLDRALRRLQVCRDFLVQLSSQHVGEDFSLSRR